MHIYTHKHHIIPRHAGGTDDPSNLIELTVIDHAIAHRHLWKMYGRLEDKMAWLGLMGRMDKEQIIKELCSRNGKKSKGSKRSAATRKRVSEAQMGEKNSFYGKKHTEESRRKMRESQARCRRNWTEESSRKIAEANRRRAAKKRLAKQPPLPI